MDKFLVAREQLLTALGLFLEDKSPVSVHVLAGNAREILASLCEKAGVQSQSHDLLDRRPDGRKLWKIVNEYRNSFKHFGDDDQEIFALFSDSDNDHMLFLAIEDYFKLRGKLTIEMRVVRNWFFANYPDRLVEEKRRLADEFSYMTGWSRAAQKEELRKQISRALVSDTSDRFHEPHLG